MRPIRKRLLRTAEAIGSMPVSPDLVDHALRHFQATGELPQERQIARAVLHQAKYGCPENSWIEGQEAAAELRRLLHSPWLHERVMTALYREAVADNDTVRTAARDVLVNLSARGFDVTEPLFAKHGIEVDLPDWGSVALWMLGFPDILVRPPYEDQARRLLDRYADLRDRVPQGNPRWFDALSAAVGAFRATGDLPRDELMRHCVLQHGEILGLLQHAQGGGDAELMAAFADLHDLAGGLNEAAVSHVQGLARQGRLAQPSE